MLFPKTSKLAKKNTVPISFRNLITKHRENRENLRREHLMGCRGVKLSLLKDVTITTVTTATVTTVTMSFRVLPQFIFLSFVTITVFEFCPNLIFLVLSQFKFLNIVTMSF